MRKRKESLSVAYFAIRCCKRHVFVIDGTAIKFRERDGIALFPCSATANEWLSEHGDCKDCRVVPVEIREVK